MFATTQGFDGQIICTSRHMVAVALIEKEYSVDEGGEESKNDVDVDRGHNQVVASTEGVESVDVLENEGRYRIAEHVSTLVRIGFRFAADDRLTSILNNLSVCGEISVRLSITLFPTSKGAFAVWLTTCSPTGSEKTVMLSITGQRKQ